MKLSNFELTSVTGNTKLNKVYFAEVDVETGAFFWKKKKRRAVTKTYFGMWHFVDSGMFTPDYQCEALARAWTAQTGQETGHTQ